MIIDAHTHHRRSSGPAVVMGIHARGIHPWELAGESSLAKWREHFWQITTPPTLMIGECGLDRARAGILAIEDQKTILEWHLQLAVKRECPVVIHCVRAHSDMMNVLKKTKTIPALLLHDFSGNQYQINEYLRYPVTFSLGKRLLNDHQLLKRIPINRLLLETDDQQTMSIEVLYQEAAKILEMDLQEFANKLEQNFLQLFGHENDICSADFIKNFN